MPRPRKQVKTLIPGLPVKPSGLSDAASAHWDRLVQEMQESGIVLVPAYRAALVQAATIQADLAVAWADVQEHGRYITGKGGKRTLNCAVDDLGRLNEKLGKALYALGLTPKSLGGNEKLGDPDKPEKSLKDLLDGA